MKKILWLPIVVWVILHFLPLLGKKSPFVSKPSVHSQTRRIRVFEERTRVSCKIIMGSGDRSPRWSVFDGVKVISATPEALMAEINSAITAFEYAHATAFQQSSSSSFSKNKVRDGDSVPQYDARMADEAYKAGLAGLAFGKLDEAIYSLNTAVSKCPPNKTSAVAKLQSLIFITSQQLQKSPK